MGAIAEWFYPTTFSCWGPEEREAIDRVLASGRLTMGPEVAAFEAALARFHGRKHAVMCNSGSSANLLMIAALANLGLIKRGDIAAVPALAWSTTYAPLVQHGLELMLLDIDQTWNADPYLPKPKWHAPPIEDARLIVGCSILGNPAPLKQWDSIAGVVDAVFINDDCESLGARIGARTTGSFGLMASQSFFWSHQLSAIEGGAVLTDDDDCDKVLRMLRAHGWTRDVRAASDPVPSFDEEYDFRCFGYNLRPLEIHATVAMCQLVKLQSAALKRAANLALFERLAAEAQLPISMQEGTAIGQDRACFGLPFMVADNEARSRLAAALRAAGIDCRPPTGGSFRLHAYGARWADEQETPLADEVHRRGMFLGNGPLDLTAQIHRAVDVMRKTL